MYCFIFSVFVSLLFSSCATMIHGKDQKVDVQSVPTGAQVYVNGTEVGETPLVLMLPRKRDYLVNVALDGYHTETARLKRTLAGTAIFYLLPGGVLSFGIDAMNGAQYKLPESVSLSLKPLFDAERLIATQLDGFKEMNSKLL